jgi:uncharacterized damage-inducible protein DinB
MLTLALDEMNRCARTSTPAAAQELVDAANRALQARAAEFRQNAATETNLDLTEQLWQARGKDCRSSTPNADDPLALVLAKIAQ